MKKTEPNQFDHGTMVLAIVLILMLLLYMMDGCHSGANYHLKEVTENY